MEIISHSKRVSSLCRTLGLVFQSENFNHNRYTNYIMDSWSYLDNPVPEQNHSKPRLHPGDDLAALTMLYEQCKVAHAKSVPKWITCYITWRVQFSPWQLFDFLILSSQSQKEQKISSCNRGGNVCKTERYELTDTWSSCLPTICDCLNSHIKICSSYALHIFTKQKIKNIDNR